MRHAVKIDQLHATVKVLDHGRAAFHPIATIVIGRSVNLADRCGMDVPAEDAIHLVVLRIADDGLLEFSDKADDIFDFGFHVCAQRPVSETGKATNQIHGPITPHQQDITDVSQVREPAHILDDGVEFMAVHNEQSSAVGRFVNRIFLECDARVISVEGGEEFIVVPDDVDDLRSLAAFAQEFLNDVIVFLRPVDTPAQRPDVDEISHEIECVEFHILKEFEEVARFTAACAKVNIRNPAGAITRCHAGLLYPPFARITKNGELLLFRNNPDFLKTCIPSMTGVLAIDSHLKQFRLLLRAILNV